MKNNVTLKKTNILDINPFNCEFLEIFIQGKKLNYKNALTRLSS